MGKKALITGTIALTIAGLITRLMGFVFRIYLSNLMGAEALGLYQLIFPIYMLIWATSSAGLSIAISKKVAEYTAQKKHTDGIRTLKSALLLVLPLSFVLSLFVFSFSNFLSVHMLREAKTAVGLRYLSLCIPFMSIACCIRGYFQGRQEMAVSAVAQVVEQVGRMAVIYVFAALYLPKGIEYACGLAALGLCGGELLSCLYTYFTFRSRRKKLPKTPPTTSYALLCSSIITISIPITANRFLISGLHAIENILIPLQLQKFGFDSSTSLSMYGMFSGMAMPLLFFPSMVTASISTVLVPALSDAVTRKNTYVLHRTVSKSIQYASLIGIGTAVLFYTLGPDIALVCYNRPEVGAMLKLLAIICPFFYLQGILTGMLNGLGLQRMTFKGNLYASICSIVAVLILVPRQGITGFVIALLIQSSIGVIYHLVHVLQHIDLQVDVINWMLKPSLAALCSYFLMRLLHQQYLVHTFNLVGATTLAAASLLCIYGILLFVFRALTKDDITLLIR